MDELIIRNARIVDGTGRPAFTGDVAVNGGRITEVGSIDRPATRVIDAEGQLLTPGFVDIHTHFDGQVCWDKQVTPPAGTASPPSSWATAASGFAPCGPAPRTR